MTTATVDDTVLRIERLIATRRAAIAELCKDWSPEENDDLSSLLTRLARDLLRESPVRRGSLSPA